MSKKKRVYGVPPLPLPLSADNFSGTIFDMHTHIDMVVEHLAHVKCEMSAAGKDAEVMLYDVADIARMSATVGINGFLHCACELDGIRNISDVLDSIWQVNVPGSDLRVEVYGAAAIHPNETVLHAAGKGGQTELLQIAEDGLEPPKLKDRHLQYDLDDAIGEVAKTLAGDSRMRVVGETGLDYFRSAEIARDVQKKSFRAHISLAKETDFALQIHDRNAHEDVIQILKADGAPKTTLFHSFSGDEEMAAVCVEHGWYTSFSGPVTFKANDDLRAALRHIWENAPHLLLVETDAPFLTPMPYRGTVNIPGMIPYTLRFMSEFLEINTSELCEVIAQNERRIFDDVH